jgi:hypothetical protein
MPSLPNNASLAAIMFTETLDPQDTKTFLNWWIHGEFDLCLSHFPEAPKEIYIGADPLYELRNSYAEPSKS